MIHLSAHNYHRRYPFFILIIVIFLSTAITSCTQKTSGSHNNGTINNQKVLQPLLITRSQSELVHIPKTVEVTGSLLSSQEAVLSSLTEGVVVKLPIEIGDKVSKNQILARIDDKTYSYQLEKEEHALNETKARLGLSINSRSNNIVIEQVPEVTQAKANLDQAKLDLNRAGYMVKEGYWPPQNLENARTKFEINKAAYQAAKESVAVLKAALHGKEASLKLARKRLNETVLPAPFSGIVRERFVNPGEYVKAGTNIISLVALNPIKFRIDVPERFANYVIPGKKIEVQVEAFPNQTITGTIVRVSPQADTTSRSYTAEALLPNSDDLLKPGFFARAKVIISTSTPVILIPENAVFSIAGIDKVFIISNNVVQTRKVQLGDSRNGKREVLNGIKPGEFVATSRLGQLTDGLTVRTAQETTIPNNK